MPISREDWGKLLKVSTGDNRALVLLMLNCGMYLEEAINVRWENIVNGCLVSHRKKKKSVLRIAVLWPETIKAIDALPKKGPWLFYARHGAKLGSEGAQKRFDKLRILAELPHVTSSHLRDGAATAAQEANVNEKLCALFLGHRSGISDHYAKRKPTMVAPACKSVAKFYGIGKA